LTKLAKIRHFANHASHILNACIHERIDLMSVHELEPSVADMVYEGMGRFREERMGWAPCVGQPNYFFIMVAGDVHGIHAGEAVQESPASGNDSVQWISE
jgi:hypothetical protein